MRNVVNDLSVYVCVWLQPGLAQAWQSALAGQAAEQLHAEEANEQERKGVPSHNDLFANLVAKTFASTHVDTHDDGADGDADVSIHSDTEEDDDQDDNDDDDDMDSYDDSCQQYQFDQTQAATHNMYQYQHDVGVDEDGDVDDPEYINHLALGLALHAASDYELDINYEHTHNDTSHAQTNSARSARRARSARIGSTHTRLSARSGISNSLDDDIVGNEDDGLGMDLDGVAVIGLKERIGQCAVRDCPCDFVTWINLLCVYLPQIWRCEAWCQSTWTRTCAPHCAVRRTRTKWKCSTPSYWKR
jgi:hypothetical protein